MSLAFVKARLNAVFAFWAAYVLTRPLGASLVDYVSQARADGGLGLGTVGTSAVFIATILGRRHLPDDHGQGPGPTWRSRWEHLRHRVSAPRQSYPAGD